ncbi:hypothetical protein [Pontibacter sp. G13]|nr:hypothetical protein [Pontibacter sp. G13]WNJ18882.1 hypothetical protein RJD25_00200 [Pontibacter sp. G13]
MTRLNQIIRQSQRVTPSLKNQIKQHFTLKKSFLFAAVSTSLLILARYFG